MEVAKNVSFKPRIALIWNLNSMKTPPFFDLVVHSLFGHRIESVELDLHVLKFKVPNRYLARDYLYIDRVFFHEVSAASWEDRIRRYVNVTLPYSLSETQKKFVDFKPMFGALFPDVIHGYDYWAYGDLDGIFGSFDATFNVPKFVQYELISGYAPKLKKNDIFHFGSRVHNCVGALTFIRNTEKMNFLFMRSKDYRTIIRDNSEIYSFDENTRTSRKKVDVMHDVLERSRDVARARGDQVVRDPLRMKAMLEMWGEFFDQNAVTVARWERDKGLSFSLVGNVQIKPLYYNQTVTSAFFDHFLQWKYERNGLFWANLKELVEAADALGYPSLNCFEIRTNATLRKMPKGLYAWNLC